MQIRISEMLDNASELIEENIEVRYTNDNDRIKRIVFSEIKYMRRKHRKTGRGRNKIMQPVTAQRIETVKDKEKDMGKKILKVMQWVLGIILGVAAALLVWNFICKKAEQSKIENAYGKTVEVNGNSMVVDIKGEDNETTIILLPGWGCASPIMEFLPLADMLSEDFKVITIEPFGYGLSDRVGTEREISVIVDELHECTQKLGCDRYYLMAHSLSGLYSLYWANTYPQEVAGFIGIDPSVPKQSDEEPLPISMVTLNRLSAYFQKAANVFGITRLCSIGHPEKAVYADTSYPYSERELEVFRILSMDFAYSGDIMNELNHMEDNLESVRDMKFPESVPVLQFVSGDNCEMMESWEPLHREVITETDKSEVLRLDGGHYLHFEWKEKIVEKVREWIG